MGFIRNVLAGQEKSVARYLRKCVASLALCNVCCVYIEAHNIYIFIYFYYVSFLFLSFLFFARRKPKWYDAPHWLEFGIRYGRRRSNWIPFVMCVCVQVFSLFFFSLPPPFIYFSASRFSREKKSSVLRKWPTAKVCHLSPISDIAAAYRSKNLFHLFFSFLHRLSWWSKKERKKKKEKIGRKTHQKPINLGASLNSYRFIKKINHFPLTWLGENGSKQMRVLSMEYFFAPSSEP